MAWLVPRSCHTYLVDHLLSGELTSVKTDVLSRYVKFAQGLQSSPSMEVAVMVGVAARDVCTSTGQNLWFLEQETGLDPLSVSASRVKAGLVSEVPPVPDRERWRLAYLAKLLQMRGQLYYEGGKTDHLTVLIDSLCTS